MYLYHYFQTATWKGRWEKSNATLLDMATEKKRRDADLLAVTKQVAQLEKLCRALQTERTSLISQLKEKSQVPQTPDEESQLNKELPPNQKDQQDSSVVLFFFQILFFRKLLIIKGFSNSSGSGGSSGSATYSGSTGSPWFFGIFSNMMLMGDLKKNNNKLYILTEPRVAESTAFSGSSRFFSMSSYNFP